MPSFPAYLPLTLPLPLPLPLLLLLLLLLLLQPARSHHLPLHPFHTHPKTFVTSLPYSVSSYQKDPCWEFLPVTG